MSEIGAFPVLVVVGAVYLVGILLKGLVSAVTAVGQAASEAAESRRNKAACRQSGNGDKTAAPCSSAEPGQPARAQLTVHSTPFRDLDVAVQALFDLGYQPAEAIKTAAAAPGFFSREGTCTDGSGREHELVLGLVSRQGNLLLGLEKTAGGVLALTPDAAGQAALQQLGQRYLYLQARKVALAQGYLVVEEARQLPDGSQRTLLRRSSPVHGTQEISLVFRSGPDGSFLQLDSDGTAPNGQRSCPDAKPFLEAMGLSGARCTRKATRPPRGGAERQREAARVAQLEKNRERRA